METISDTIEILETLLQPTVKGTLLGTPNREPQEYSRKIIGNYLTGSLCSIIFLLYSWGSLFGVPIRALLTIIHITSQPQKSRTGDSLMAATQQLQRNWAQRLLCCTFFRVKSCTDWHQLN